MGVISITSPADGETIDAADIATPLNVIVEEINGNIDNANIKTAAAIDGSKLASDSVTNTQIAFGGAGNGVWWEEIGRTTLTVAGDSINITSLPSRKYLMLIVSLVATGGTINAALRFNGDGAANYTYLVSSGLSTPSSAINQAQVYMTFTAVSEEVHAVVEMHNIAAKVKLGRALVNQSAGSSAGTAPSSRDSIFKWANTSTVINQVTVTNTGTGDYAIGSEVVVLGHD